MGCSVKKYKENSEKNFNKQAKSYDHSIYSMYPRKCYKHVIEEIQKREYVKLLDVGCGTGEVLNRIATDSQKYYGLDISQNMLEKAKNKDNASNVTYILGDSEFLPFEDASFDMVTCVESFHHYPNPQNVMKEFKRVLRPRGCLIICDMYRKAPLRQFYNLLMKIVNTGDVKIYTKREMRDMLERAGFRMTDFSYPTKQTFLCICEKE